METIPIPSDEAIGTACAEGKAFVIALFHDTVGRLAARVQMLEEWISNDSPVDLNEGAGPSGGRSREIHRGDIYWATLTAPGGLQPNDPHPCVVLQDDVINRSRIPTVVVCALTTNQKRANAPGNIWLDAGEANLPKTSVVEVSKVSAVDKSQLGEYIGTLPDWRMDQIWAGMRFLQSMER